MHLLVTGGTGFVMSNVVKHVLASSPDAVVSILELGPPSDVAKDFFGEALSRIHHFEGDICERQSFDRVSREHDITHVIHGAAYCHAPEREQTNPTAFVSVNVLGTMTVMEWARSTVSLQRLICVSSGGVYGDPSQFSSEEPQREDGPFNPPELYAISKYAGEQIARRYGELFDIDVRRVRFSAVFGPMERPTSSRSLMSLPYHIARSLIDQRPLRLTRAGLHAGGDFLSSMDVGAALDGLLRADGLAGSVYNIAGGEYIRFKDMIDVAEAVAPDLRYELVEDGDQADFHQDPALRLGRWNAYAIDAIRNAVGWKPRSFEMQLRSYLEWVMEDPDRRCPPLGDDSRLSTSRT